MLNHAIVLLLVLTSPLLCSATLSAQQPTVHDLAERVDRHYNQLHSLKAQFTETYEGLVRPCSADEALHVMALYVDCVVRCRN